jgi:predicted nucleotidyltransferase component of viral defense system
MGKPYLSPFVLVGGTALALQIGHRISIDLDLFCVQDFDTEELLPNLLNDYALTVSVKMPQTLICSIEQIKVDFIRFKYPFIRPIKHEQGIRMLSLEDIAPMKLDAITGRGSKKDFFDLYFLLQRYSLLNLLELYQEKYPHQTLFHVVKSLTYFEDAEQMPDPITLDRKVSWGKVKKGIVQAVKSL